LNSYLLFTKIILELTETKIVNPTRSDFKYTTDFGFMKKCRIPSDSESESGTSLLKWAPVWHTRLTGTSLACLIAYRHFFTEKLQTTLLQWSSTVIFQLHLSLLSSNLYSLVLVFTARQHSLLCRALY